MSISAILEVMIGVAFIYLLLSLVITAFTELLSSALRRRPGLLRVGVGQLLQDNDKDTTKQFYEHPLVKALRQPPWFPRLFGSAPEDPSYIPPGVFSQALIDMTAPGNRDPAAIERALSNEGLPQELRRALKALFEASGKDPTKFQAAIEVWFNDAMERVSGWYKRQVSSVILALSIVLVVLANADTLQIVKTLWRSPTLRANLVAEAEAFAKQHATEVQKRVDGQQPENGPPPQTPDVQPEIDTSVANVYSSLNRLETLSIPLGWANFEDDPDRASALETYVSFWPAFRRHYLGWALSVFAISMGAPFWFDALNRLIAIRGAGKKPDTPDEKAAKQDTKGK